MTSLSDPDVAKDLELSEGQIKQINEVLASEEIWFEKWAGIKVSATMEQRLKQVLTQSQFVIWQGMAGQKIGSSSARLLDSGCKVENKAEDLKANDGKGNKCPRGTAPSQQAKRRMPSFQAMLDGAMEPDLVLNFKENPLGRSPQVDYKEVN